MKTFNIPTPPQVRLSDETIALMEDYIIKQIYESAKNGRRSAQLFGIDGYDENACLSLDHKHCEELGYHQLGERSKLFSELFDHIRDNRISLRTAMETMTADIQPLGYHIKSTQTSSPYGDKGSVWIEW